MQVTSLMNRIVTQYNVLHSKSNVNFVEIISILCCQYYWCRDGAFGTVRVQYRTYAVDTVEEATSDGSSVLDYYNSPLSGTPLPLAAWSGTSWDVTSQPQPLIVCTALNSCIFAQKFSFMQNSFHKNAVNLKFVVC